MTVTNRMKALVEGNEQDYEGDLGKARAELADLEQQAGALHTMLAGHLKHAPKEDLAAYKQLLQKLSDAVSGLRDSRRIIKSSLWDS